MVRRWVRIPLFLLGMLALAALGVALSFPYLAVNEPSGARTAVIEGWIPQEFMSQVKAEIDRHGYEHVYITGTPRNLSYTLNINDTIVVELREPRTGVLVARACGSDGTGFRIIADRDTIMQHAVAPDCADFKAEIQDPVEELVLVPTTDRWVDPKAEILSTQYMTLDGVNLHTLLRSISIHRSDGTREAGLPTFADLAAAELRKAGLDEQVIITLPTLDNGESRTWANARLFASRAAHDSIRAVDVISFGIHGRRSRVTYQTACGPGVDVGIISIRDPAVLPGVWWRDIRGWVKVLKELAGVPTSYLVKEVN